MKIMYFFFCQWSTRASLQPQVNSCTEAMHMESITSSLRGTYHVVFIVSSSHCHRIANSLLRVRPRAACSAFVCFRWLAVFFFFRSAKFFYDSALWGYALRLLSEFLFVAVRDLLWRHCRVADTWYWRGTNTQPRWRSWLRHCATSRKIAGSVPDGVDLIPPWGRLCL